MPITKKFDLKNQKGLKLAVSLDMPNTELNIPYVILLHGFTGWKEERHIKSLAELLAKHGIGSIRFDASGSGESEGVFYDDYRLSNYLSDLETIYDFLINKNDIDSKRIGLWAHSFGAQIMTQFLYQHHEIKAACFCQGTIRVQGKAHLDKVKDEWKSKGRREFDTETMGRVRLPYDFYLERQQNDGYKVLRNLKMPKLFIAGSEDNLVPLASVQEAFEIANEPKEYYLCQKADHFYKNNPKKLNEINERTLKFFKDNL